VSRYHLKGLHCSLSFSSSRLEILANRDIQSNYISGTANQITEQRHPNRWQNSNCQSEYISRDSLSDYSTGIVIDRTETANQMAEQGQSDSRTVASNQITEPNSQSDYRTKISKQSQKSDSQSYYRIETANQITEHGYSIR